jgi:hypothetical protein
MDATRLAILKRTGLATKPETEELAAQTIAICRSAARRHRGLTPEDRDDIAMKAAERAMESIKEWQPVRAAWTTWCHHVVRSVASAWARRERRMREACGAYAEWNAAGGEIDDE